MLRFSQSFIDTKVISLQTGKHIATLNDPIINPHNLKIEAFYVTARSTSEPRVVFIEDIREIGLQGCIVDSEENIMELDGLVRLDELLKINFALIDKKVETEMGTVVGKVTNYTIDDSGFSIEKLYVRPTLVKLFTNSDRIIGRGQIVNVDDEKITVKDTVIQSGETAKKPSFNPLAH